MNEGASAHGALVEQEMRITETKEGSIIEVHVKPRSREFKVTIEGDEVVVFCREEPVNGKVNKELLKEFSKLFRTRVELVSGAASRQKRILTCSLGVDEVQRILLEQCR